MLSGGKLLRRVKKTSPVHEMDTLQKGPGHGQVKGGHGKSRDGREKVRREEPKGSEHSLSPLWELRGGSCPRLPF